MKCDVGDSKKVKNHVSSIKSTSVVIIVEHPMLA